MKNFKVCSLSKAVMNIVLNSIGWFTANGDDEETSYLVSLVTKVNVHILLPMFQGSSRKNVCHHDQNCFSPPHFWVGATINS